MTHAKPLAAVLLFAAAVGAVYFLPTVNFGARPELKDAATLMVDQETVRMTKGKYKQFMKDEWKPNTIVEEYVTPTGEPGYQVTEWEQRKDGKHMRSYGRGPEAIHRSYDWILTEPVPVATST